jgi:hypothetical protein
MLAVAPRLVRDGLSWALAALALAACGPAPDFVEYPREARAPTYEVVGVAADPVVVVTCPGPSVCAQAAPPVVVAPPPPPPAPVVVVAPPPPVVPVIAAPPVVARVASPDAAVQAAIRRIEPKLRRCYEKGLRRYPLLAGSVVARLRVDDDGEVDSAKDAGSTMPDRRVVKCVLGELDDLEIPGAAERTVVVPIPFSPRR